MRNISLVTQNQNISSRNTSFFLSSNTRFEPPFQIWASKQRTIYFVFCDLQNEVSQDRSQFEILDLPPTAPF